MKVTGHRFGIPALAVSVTAALELLIGYITGTSYPHLFFTFPVLLCAWFYGRYAGIVATVLASVAIEYFFKPPFFALDWDLVHTLLFVLDGIVISLFASAKGEAEEKLHVLNNELESRVLERTNEVERISRTLREREVLSALGTAVAKIVHEIATPVNTISTAVNVLERKFPQPSPAGDQGLELLRSIAEETARLEVFIREIREVSRPLRLKFGAVRVDDLAAEAIAAVRAIKKDHQPIELERDFPEDLPSVLGDREKLREALINLIRNAFEAMPKGGNLTLRGYSFNNRVCLEIRDTGEGIPKDMNAFDLFVTSKEYGWGLGLPTVRQVIVAHDGTIDYVSELGQGTTFKISLPVS